MDILDEPAAIARNAANSVLGADAVRDVWAARVSDSEGLPAIRIVLAMPADALETVTGEQLIDAIGTVHERLEASGEERRAIVSFTSTDDPRLQE